MRFEQHTEKREKRYYKKGDIVWATSLKDKVVVKSVNPFDLEIVVEQTVGNSSITHTLPLWGVDNLKYRELEKMQEGGHSSPKKTERFARVSTGHLTVMNWEQHAVDVKVAKVRPDAIIPTKRKEDAGYDIYANLEKENGRVELWCYKGKTTLVPTGIAMALPDTHYFNAKHERGSTGKIGLSVLAGVVDSGYRGELFIALVPLTKDVVITDAVKDVEDIGNVILYPYSKAIAQGTIDLVPNVKIEEVTYEDLLSIESERGLTKLGESGK